MALASNVNPSASLQDRALIEYVGLTIFLPMEFLDPVGDVALGTRRTEVRAKVMSTVFDVDFF